MPSNWSPQYKVGNVGSRSVILQGQNIQNITYGSTAEELVAVLEAKGVIQTAKGAGLERQAVIKLAQRLKPDDVLEFEQAVTELECAVAIALDVIARGEHGTNEDAFVNAVLAQVASKGPQR